VPLPPGNLQHDPGCLVPCIKLCVSHVRCLSVCLSQPFRESVHVPAVLFGTMNTQLCSLVLKRDWMGLFGASFCRRAVFSAGSAHPGAELLH